MTIESILMEKWTILAIVINILGLLFSIAQQKIGPRPLFRSLFRKSTHHNYLVGLKDANIKDDYDMCPVCFCELNKT